MFKDRLQRIKTSWLSIFICTTLNTWWLISIYRYKPFNIILGICSLVAAFAYADTLFTFKSINLPYPYQDIINKVIIMCWVILFTIASIVVWYKNILHTDTLHYTLFVVISLITFGLLYRTSKIEIEPTA